jgi:predicted metal-dependent peptidase
MNAKDKLTKARAGLVLDYPFYASLALRLNVREDAACETAYTDGVSLGYNPAFVDTLTLAQTKGLLAHEVMHCANQHMVRRGSRDAREWNRSCDYAINSIVLESGFELPENGCVDIQYDGMSAEAIYAKRQQDESEKQAGKGGSKPTPGGAGTSQDQPGTAPSKGNDARQQSNDPGRCGEVRDAPKGSDAKHVENDWRIAVVQAARAAKSAGNLPGSLAKLVEEVAGPPLPWYTLLRDFLDRTARDDYSWSLPNRRYIARGLYMPGMDSEELPAIVVSIDVSGSTVSYWDRFAAQLSDILSEFKTTIYVLWTDTRVAHVDTLTNEDLPLKGRLSIFGGGGTSFRPPFEWVEQNAITPACMIYLTDLYGQVPPVAPEYPVLWVCTSDQKAPWGETIKMH